jgi:hypothetical protein
MTPEEFQKAFEENYPKGFGAGPYGMNFTPTFTLPEFDMSELLSGLDPQLAESIRQNLEKQKIQDTKNNLKKQILGQNITDKWSGQGHGSAEANAEDMANILAGIGITDVRQFGQLPVYEPVDVMYKYNGYYGTPIGDGNLNVLVPGRYGLEWGSVPIENATKEYHQYDMYNDTSNPVDSAKVKIVDGKPVIDTGRTTYGNKVTGQVVPNTYSERQQGNAWGGTFAGKGNTGYRVQFTPDGTPVFYTTGASSNTLSNLMADLGPVGQIAIAVATGGLSIPQQIAAQMAIQVLSGKDIGDAIKGAAISMAVANIPGADLVKEGVSYLGGIDPSGVLSSAFQNAAVSGVKAAITGDSIGDAVLAGAASGGVGGAIGAMLNTPDFANLTDAEKRIATNAITGVISGKPLDQVLINSAIAAAKTELASSKAEASGGIQNRVVDEAIQQGGVEQQLTDAGLITSDGQFADSGTLTDADITKITGSETGSYTGVNLAGPGEGVNTGIFVPSWLSITNDEQIVGVKIGDEGQKVYEVERINPNNPEQSTTYSVDRDPVTGKIYYETYGVDADGNTTVKASQTKPVADWEAENNALNEDPLGEVPAEVKAVDPDEGSGQGSTFEDLLKELERTTEAPEFVDPFAVTEAPFVGPRPLEQSAGSAQSPADDPFGQLRTPTLDDILSGSPTLTNTTPPVAELPAVTSPSVNVTSEEVEQIVNDALSANPSLTAEDVQQIVTDAVATVPTLTADQVREIVSEEVEKVPTGATPEDVSSAITAYMEQNPGLSQTDVSNAVADYMEANPGLTAADLNDAISTATEGLATTTQLADLQNSLSDAIQAAKDIGLEGDAALQAGIDSVASQLDTTKEALLTELGTTEAALRSDMEAGLTGVSTEITDARTALQDAIKSAQDAGLEGDAALQAAIDAVAANQQTDTDELLERLGYTEEELKAQIEAQGTEFGTQLGGVRDDVANLASELGTTKDNLLEQLGYTEAELKNLIGTQGAEFGEQLEATETSLLEKLGYTEDELRALIGDQGAALGEQLGGVQDSVANLADDLGTTKDDLLEQLGYTEEELRALIGEQGESLGEQIEQQGVNFGNMFTNFGNMFSKFQTDAQKQAAVVAEQAAAQRIADQKAAAERDRQASIKTATDQGAQQLQAIQQQLPSMFQTTSTPLYGTMEYFDPFGDPFAEKKMRMASSTNPAEKPKMAAGGYIDDLLAEDLSVDDLMNLLR